MFGELEYRWLIRVMGIMTVVAILLILVTVAWPQHAMAVGGGGDRISPKWTHCGYAYICYPQFKCDPSHPEKEWEDVLCYTDGVGWYWQRICVNCW